MIADDLLVFDMGTKNHEKQLIRTWLRRTQRPEKLIIHQEEKKFCYRVQMAADNSELLTKEGLYFLPKLNRWNK